MKPQSVKDMVEEFGEVLNQAPNPDLYQKLVTEEYYEWITEAVKDRDYIERKHNPEAELKELADLVYVIYGRARAMGWDLEEALSRVHKNNLGRCIQPDGTIQRRDSGKIVKNKDYPKVDLKDLV